MQDLQTNRVVDRTCTPTTSLPIESSLFPKSVNLHEIPVAVHIVECVLAHSVLCRGSLRHKSQDASAETFTIPPPQIKMGRSITKPLRQGAYRRGAAFTFSARPNLLAHVQLGSRKLGLADQTTCSLTHSCKGISLQ